MAATTPLSRQVEKYGEAERRLTALAELADLADVADLADHERTSSPSGQQPDEPLT
ncbi:MULTISPECIES: hypothetical protein [Streptomyces]|uniref:hypothetical protein n=1 Tax=Streptomyces TaxID=1883 RepID=UPI0015C599D1